MLAIMSNFQQDTASFNDNINNGEHHRDDYQHGSNSNSNESGNSSTSDADPMSPFAKSPWFAHMLPRASSFDEASASPNNNTTTSYNGLMGSLVREEGHIYSLATSGDLLYTGSDSKNIRVWKNQKEYSGFKSNSGLVKSIVISGGNKIFTGHQDGKIRVWKMSRKNPTIHKRIGTLPTFKALLKSSINPSNYVDIGRNRNTIWLRHFDAISSLSLSEDQNYLYSASWDKTIKVWRTSSFKCLESIAAHDDAVNSVVAGFDALVFTGSADGTVKVWQREVQGKGTKHFFSQYLLKQECAVTTLAVDTGAGMIYCGSSNGQVNFWDKLGFGSVGGILKGHKLAVLCITTTGCLIFSGSADMSICVWRRISSDAPPNGIDHLCLSVLTGHNGPVKCLAAVSTGDSKSLDTNLILYSGSLDKSVKLWRVSERIPENVLISYSRKSSNYGGESFNL